MNLARVCKKLKLNMDDVCVADYDDNLLLLHHRDSEKYTKESNVRGWAYDMNKQRLVAKGLPKMKVVVTDHLTEGQVFYEGYEGVVLRVYRVNGITYVSTNKKIDCSRSKWGDSISFKQMYLNLGGQTDSLFTSNDSPFCYLFLVVHPQLALVSKQDIGEGKLIYIDTMTMWKTNEKPVKFERTNVLNLEQANQVLEKGGFVVSNKGVIYRSKVYDNALNLRGNNPSFFNILIQRIQVHKSNKEDNPVEKAYNELKEILPEHRHSKLLSALERYNNIPDIIYDWLRELEEDDERYKNRENTKLININKLINMTKEQLKDFLYDNDELILKLFSKVRAYNIAKRKNMKEETN